MKINFFVFLAVAALALASCSNYSVKVGVMHAPEIVIAGKEGLYVDRFEVFGQGTESELSYLSERHKVLLQNEVSEDLTFELSRTDSSGARIGGSLVFKSSLTPLSTNTVTVEVTEDEDQDKKAMNDDEKEPEKKYEHTTYYSLTRTAVLEVNLEVDDGLKNKRFYPTITLDEASTVIGESLSDVTERVGTANTLWLSLTRQSVSEIMKRIQISYANEPRYFEKVKKNKQFKIANKAASKGDWNYALGVWEIEASLSPMAEAASFYNQSIYYESIGDLKTAGKLMEDAISVYPRSKYFKRLSVLRQLSKEAKIIEDTY